MTHADGPLEPSTPGNGHAGVTPLFATFMTFFVVVSVVGSCLFWKRRHTFPISARFPLFAVVGQVLACLWVILDSVRHIQKGSWPCQLVNFVAQMCIPLFLANYTVRAFGLLFKFGVARARALVDSQGAANFEARGAGSVAEQNVAMDEAVVNSQPPPPRKVSLEQGPEQSKEGVQLELIRHGSTDSTDQRPDNKGVRAIPESPEVSRNTDDNNKYSRGNTEYSQSESEHSRHSQTSHVSHIIEDYESDYSDVEGSRDFFSVILPGGPSARRIAATYFLKRRRFGEKPFLWRLYAITLLVHGSVWFSGVIILIDSCDYHTLETVIAGLVFIYLCLWVVLAYKLKKTGRDNFGFKEELGLSAVFAFSAIVIWSVYGNLPATIDWDENVFALSDLLPMLAAVPALYVSIWRPVYISYKSERESEALKRKMEQEANAKAKMQSRRRSEHLSKLTLRELLGTEIGFDTFKQFLQSEFSVENISFWRRINQYKIEGESNKPFVELLRIARLIGHEYILPNCVMEVNIPARQSKEIIQKLGLKRRAQPHVSLLQIGRTGSRRRSGSFFKRSASRQNSDNHEQERRTSQYSDVFDDAPHASGAPNMLLTPKDSRTNDKEQKRDQKNSKGTLNRSPSPNLSPARKTSRDNVLRKASTSSASAGGDDGTDQFHVPSDVAPHRLSAPPSRAQTPAASGETSRSSAQSTPRALRTLLTPQELRCVFDGAQKEIYNLMAKDSFLRYRRSTFFAQFIQRCAAEVDIGESEDDDGHDLEQGGKIMTL